MLRRFEIEAELYRIGAPCTCSVSSRSHKNVKSKMKKIAGNQIKAARDLLGFTQGELATAAGVGRNTINRFENGQIEPHQESLDKIVSELERRGIEFTNGRGMGVRLDSEKAAGFARTTGQARKEADR